MPVALTYPGVYIEEVPSGVRTITGVATSITAFIGRALQGPADEAVRIQSFAEYTRIFGGLWQASTMSQAVNHFFQHGGSDAIIVRVFNGNVAASTATITLATATGSLVLEASSPGTWGAALRATVDHDTRNPPRRRARLLHHMHQLMGKPTVVHGAFGARTDLCRARCSVRRGRQARNIMISHALTIVRNELEKHLATYGAPGTPQVELGNLAEGFSNGTSGGVPRNKIIFSLVNIKEEKTLKNIPNHVRHDVTLRVTYEKPPVFLNFVILVTATHVNYADALLALSRAILFFQFRNVFTQDNVDPNSITTNAPVNALDRLDTFKLIFDLYSPTLEEVNYLWSTLGGKQYPFVLYGLRMLDLKFQAVQSESGLITEVVSSFSHKGTLAN
jgi:hypothetical protein